MGRGREEKGDYGKKHRLEKEGWVELGRQGEKGELEGE